MRDSVDELRRLLRIFDETEVKYCVEKVIRNEGQASLIVLDCGVVSNCVSDIGIYATNQREHKDVLSEYHQLHCVSNHLSIFHILGEITTLYNILIGNFPSFRPSSKNCSPTWILSP